MTYQDDQGDMERIFHSERHRFQIATEFAKEVSKNSAGREAPLRHVLGSYVFTRMCVSAETILYLIGTETGLATENTLDHFSIAILSRSLIEASLMLHYLTEPSITEEEWELRRAILDLHDYLLRARLFKGLGADAADEYEGWKHRAAERRAAIKALPAFGLLSKDRKEKIMRGSELYVNGIRGVLTQFSVDRGYFDAIHNYLSGQVHVAPSTFYYMHEGRIDFLAPAPYQLYVSSFSIANARYFLIPAAIRMLSIDTIVSDAFSEKRIAEMNELASVAFGA